MRSGGAIRLVFTSPERLVNTDVHRVLREAGAHTVAVDEAHCISQWGHDFRPEYRQLAQLRNFFPGVSIHGYTATATERVRHDIVEQLKLHEPELLVGNFDRPNLTYRVLPRLDLVSQLREAIDRHKGDAGIIYCLRRRDVDGVTAVLRSAGYRVAPYHAGMTSEDRRAAQEAFASERADIVVATVAFGMGIDRSNVRFVVHAAMPKSVEHYQQETRPGWARRVAVGVSASFLDVGRHHVPDDHPEVGGRSRRSPEYPRDARPPRRDGALLSRRDLPAQSARGYFGQRYRALAAARATSVSATRATCLMRPWSLRKSSPASRA